MQERTIGILTTSVALCALLVATDALAFGRGGGGGGGGHFGGGGGHFGGGFGGHGMGMGGGWGGGGGLGRSMALAVERIGVVVAASEAMVLG